MLTWLTCHVKIHMFSSPARSVFEGRSAKLATAQVQQGAAMAFVCNLGPGGPMQPVLWEGAGRRAGWGKTDRKHVLLPSVFCLFSSVQGLSLKGQDRPVSSGSSNTGCSYTNIRLQRDPFTVTPFFPRPPP